MFCGYPLPKSNGFDVLWLATEKEVCVIGRRDESKALRTAYESSYSEFVTLYGRRRIGKTFLVNETFGYEFAFHCAGLSIFF